MCVSVFVVSQQRHSVHSAFRESVMQAGKQPPSLLKRSDVLFIRGGKASSVFNLATTATAAEITACSFLSPRTSVGLGGGFCFRNNVLENARPVIHFPQ